MWYDHQILRLMDTFAKKSKAWQKCASFSHFTDLCGKKSKNKKRHAIGFLFISRMFLTECNYFENPARTIVLKKLTFCVQLTEIIKEIIIWTEYEAESLDSVYKYYRNFTK